MKTLLVIMLFASPVVVADVEIVPCGNGTDLFFVSWISAAGDACLARYEGSTISDQTVFSDRMMASVSVCDSEPDSYHVLFVISEDGWGDDSLYSIHPISLTVQDVVAIERLYHDMAQYKLLKYPDERWDGFLTGFYYGYCSSCVNIYWFTNEFDVDVDGSISMGTLLFEEETTPLVIKDDTLINWLVGPVVCQNGWPVFATEMHYAGYQGWPGYTLLKSLVHNPPSDSLNLLSDVFYYASDTLPYDPCVMAFGSCSEKGLLLWADEWGDVLYSDFDCIDPVYLSTQIYKWDCSLKYSPCAMSGNPADDGLLLVWYNSCEIRCRHYHDGWNEFDRIVQTGLVGVIEGNIDVCSVEDGYWVAWLEGGASEPELVFVPRDTVTGIGSQEESDIDNLSIVLSPNPCYNCLSISLNGISAESRADLMIYNAAGRLIRTIAHANSNGPVLWDCCDSDGDYCGQGMYFIRLTTGEQMASGKVILLR